MKKFLGLLFALIIIVACYYEFSQKWVEITVAEHIKIEHKWGGATLGYSPNSGVSLLEKHGCLFKDLNRNGKIDLYENWKESPEKRAKDLASRLSIDEIAGLMLYSGHQAVPMPSYGEWFAPYNGVRLEESGLPHSALTDDQKKFLREDNLRAVLVVRVESPRIAAEWNNNLQAYVEGLGHGIPVNISSDPRNEAEAWAEFNAGSGGKISLWPCPLGLAATFSPEIVERFGEVAASEYRALGIATALSPQIDLATEPRWLRFYGTFGEDPKLDADIARAYIDGFQSSKGESEIQNGWGYQSVNAMVKHWPGGGSGEGGRDAHFSYGKYAVYPGNKIQDHIYPFIEGAFKLNGKTQKASAVMPYYTISYGLNPSGENVGNSFSKYIITDLLREKYGYNGVVCTDWVVTGEPAKLGDSWGKSWGVEHLSVSERHYKALKAGVDQFGGNNEKKPVIDAYHMWVNDFGEELAKERFQNSAERLLLNMFRTGLFDNPYVDPERTEKLVGCPEYMAEGYAAQLKAGILLKNHNNILPIKTGKIQNSAKELDVPKVYIPKRHVPESKGFFGQKEKERWEYAIDTSLVSRYYDVVLDPKMADFAIVGMKEPYGGYGFDLNDIQKGGNGYLPISLQYSEYIADLARETSIAGGDPDEKFTNRSYKNKSIRASNYEDLQMVKDTKKIMGNRPVIVVISALRPFVAEFEPYSDGIFLSLGVQYQAIMDLMSGQAEPYGLLPMQMPKNMITVERQNEDVYGDMDPYVDEDGNVWDFAFGLNYEGIINDARTKKYSWK